MPKRTKIEYHEEDLQNALREFLNDENLSLRALAKKHAVPYSTLQNHAKGTKYRSESHQSRQKLTVDEESQLVAWITMEHRAGTSPSYTRMRTMADTMLQARGSAEVVGHNWHEGFLRRNPSIKAVKGRKIEMDRIESATPDAIHEYFDRLEDVVAQYSIKSHNTYNFDEHGVAIGVIGNEIVLVNADTPKSVFTKEDGSREWVTIIEVVQATRIRKIPPLFIYKGQFLQSTWFPSNFSADSVPPGTVFDHSTNGWTSNAIGLKWLKHFIKHSEPANPED